MIMEAMPVVQQLNSREKRQLAVELWNSADSEDGEVSVDDSILALIDQRLKAHAADSGAVSTWDEVKQRVFGSHGV